MQQITTRPPDLGSPDSTTELVRRSQAGDVAAFESLYRLHVGTVYALCLRMSGDSVAASELTQDVFVRAWAALRGFRAEAAFSTWLYRIAYNVVREEQRSTARRRSRVTDADDEELAPVHPHRGLSEDARIDLERAIAKLPERARNALILHDIQGYRCREVAELTGTAVGTIQAHLHRARKMLRDILER